MYSKNEKGEYSKQIAEAAYRSRLGHLKRAQEHSVKGETAKAVQHYLTYLKALSIYFNVDESKLSPKLFDPKNITEQLLISQVYWDLAKAYDKNPKTVREAMRCLNQFVKFSIGFKYQRVNADTVRKYLRKSKVRNRELFEETYERIKVTNKACYLATHCYGEDDPILDILRNYRDKIDCTSIGHLFVSLYYYLSPRVIKILKRVPKLDRLLQAIVFKPIINYIVKNISKKQTNL